MAPRTKFVSASSRARSIAAVVGSAASGSASEVRTGMPHAPKVSGAREREESARRSKGSGGGGEVGERPLKHAGVSLESSGVGRPPPIGFDPAGDRNEL